MKNKKEKTDAKNKEVHIAQRKAAKECNTDSEGLKDKFVGVKL